MMKTYVDMRPALRADVNFESLERVVDETAEAIRDAIYDEEESSGQAVSEVRICQSLWPKGARVFEVDGIKIVSDESLSNGAIVCLKGGGK